MKGTLLGVIGILLVSVMMGVAYASPDSTDNNHRWGSFRDGDIDLQLSDQDESWRDGVAATWTAANMAPGDEFTFDGSFVGLQSNHRGTIDITCLYQVFEESPQIKGDTDPQTDQHPEEMAKQMVIDRFTYSSSIWEIDSLTGELTITLWHGNAAPVVVTNDDWQLQDVDGDGRITLYDLSQGPVTNLPSPRWGGAHGTRLRMGVRFDQGAGNEFQGDTFDLTVVFTIKPR